jgi:2,5-diketo-D-gluconate reductase A
MNNNYSQTVPKIGLGTYNMSPEEAEIMTFESIKHGYRHIDTAAVYRNEEGVAKGLNKVFNETDLIREDIFITTKLWPGGLMKRDLVKNYDGARKSFEKSMLRLGLDYLDLYLIHSPHAKGKRLDQWRALVDLKESGRVKQIGVSNWGETHINELLKNDLPLPDANQIELHPWSQKPDLVKYLRSNDIEIIAYSSLVPLSTWRHKKGENSKKTEEMQSIGNQESSPFKLLAEKYNVTEAQFLLQWAIQNNYAVLPKSIQIDRMQENFDYDFVIAEDDIEYIKTLDKGDSVTWEYGDPLAVK